MRVGQVFARSEVAWQHTGIDRTELESRTAYQGLLIDDQFEVSERLERDSLASFGTLSEAPLVGSCKLASGGFVQFFVYGPGEKTWPGDSPPHGPDFNGVILAWNGT